MAVWLYPRRRFTILTPLAPADALARLRGATEPPRRFGLGGSLAFEGNVHGNWFEARRIIRYRNAFLPRIAATVEPTPGGARLTGTMSLHPGVLAFMILWLGASVAFSVALLHQEVSAGRLDVRALVLLVMPTLGILLPLAGFLPEVRKARQLLIDLLDGRLEAPP